MAAKKKNKTEEDITDIHSLPDHTQEQLALPLKGSPDLAEQSKEQLINKLQDLQIHLEIQEKELRNSHLALEVSRDKYLDLYDFAPLGYLTLNDNALITDVNLTGAMLFGAERNEIINHRFEQFIAPEDFERWNKFFANLKSQHIKKQVCTFMFIREDGSTFPAQLEGVRTISNDGAIEIHIAITDITDISEAEKALRESEEKYRDIFENSATGLFKTNPEGALIAVNDAFARIYDYSSAAEMIADNQKLENLYISSTLYANPEDRKEIYRILAEKGKVENFETLHCKRDGTRIWMSITARAVRNSEGTVLFVEGTIIDITERKVAEVAVRASHDQLTKSEADLRIHQIEIETQAEELKKSKIALEESRDKFIDLYDFAPLGYLTLNDKALITEVNLTGATLLGIERSKLINARFRKFIAQPDQEVWDRYFMHVLDQDNKQTCSLSLNRSDGSMFPARLESIRIIRIDGTPTVRVAVSDITDIQKAEEALLLEKNYSDRLFDAPHDTVFLFEPSTGKPIRWNKRFSEESGYTDDEIAGMKAPRDFYDKADLNKATEAMARNYTENVTVELSLVTKQGAYIPFEYSATPIETTDGKTLLLSIGRNITERKQADEKLVATLKRAQDQQAALGEISFSPHLFSGDVHGLSARLTEISSSVLSVERASVWLFNNNEDELRCIDLYEVLYDRHSYDGILKRREYVNEFEALSTAKYIDADDPLTDPRTAGYVKGYLKPNRITSMLDAVIRVSGQNLGVLCFEHVDCSHRWESDEITFACQLADQIAITLLNLDRKRAEEALKESEEKYRSIVENSNDAIYIHDFEGTIIDVNENACRMVGYDKGELVGANLSKIDKGWRIPVNNDLEQSLRKSSNVFERDNICKNGSVIRVDVSVKIIHRDGKGIIQAFVRDITERKELEKEKDYQALELKKVSSSLAAANKKLNLLSSITRHDINNQLTVLQGYLTILKMKQPDPILNEYCSKAATAAQRISSMIQFTKEYDSIGVNAPVWQDYRTLVDTATKQAPLGKVMVKNDLPAGTEVFADPLIVKVFYNLMDNAVRYGGKITTIRFSVDEAGDDHVIICEDDGDGVIAEEKDKIFDRGFGKNTGLGLALSREILSITGITIRETGEPGKGARFEMMVPKGAWRITQRAD